MEFNAEAEISRLEIDSGIRNLISQLWEHDYKTHASCEGHGKQGYVIVSRGDGWFDTASSKFGFSRVPNSDCCDSELEAEIRAYGLDPLEFTDTRMTCGCGAGVNGHIVYRGMLKTNDTPLTQD